MVAGRPGRPGALVVAHVMVERGEDIGHVQIHIRLVQAGSV